MQFHLDGFQPGDPRVLEPAAPRREGGSPDEVDVLIVGCGPAGLTLAAQMAAFPDINTRIVEQKSGPLRMGQADGVACRTMEMFAAFGFAERVKEEGYWVEEVSFWKPDPERPGEIHRSGRVRDVEDGLSEMPHVILNQARVHDYYLEFMRNSSTRLEPIYDRQLLALEITREGEPSHPVTVRLERLDEGHEGEVETVRARFVVGCDGARSATRKAIGAALHGDSANQAWGVMDVLAVTDFPDARLKSAIQSSNEGSALIIPREGGYLFRVYIELNKLNPDERVSSLALTSEHLVAAARRILRPYTLDVKEIVWWSAYEIGQRIGDRFDDLAADAPETAVPRVFIAGDACHTHSPKAGQGMNVSMQDAFNLGWKLAAVLRGRASPALLRTYARERRAVARELIDFDREWAKMFSAPPKDPTDPQSEGVDPAEFQRYFVQQGRFTAGTATRYSPSTITGEPTWQALAEGFPIGMRFHSAPVIRLADGRPLHLGHVAKADGRWRLYIFADAADPRDPASRLAALCEFLGSPRSPVRMFTPEGADIDSVIDARAIFQQHRHALGVEALPAFLLPAKGRHRLRDYEKGFCPDPTSDRDIFDMRGVDRRRGCVVIARPDQYVAHVLPLDGFDELERFFAGFMQAAGK